MKSPGDVACAELRGLALLGWMERERALRFLRGSSPSVGGAEAEELWRGYRSRVERLGEGRPLAPEPLPLSDRDRMAIEHFQRQWPVQHPGQRQPEILKLNARRLIAFQLTQCEEQSRLHRSSDEHWAPFEQLAVPRRVKPPLFRRREDGGLVLRIPYAECRLAVDRDISEVVIEETGAYLCGSWLSQDRIALWSGNHRALAAIRRSGPDPSAPAPVMVVMMNEPGGEVPRVVSYGSRPVQNSTLAEMLGPAPALIEDFTRKEHVYVSAIPRLYYELEVKWRLVSHAVTG